MNKLRTIIRLYEDHTGLKSISSMARSSRTTIKKYISKWNSLDMSYEEFQSKSDAELNELFCVADDPDQPSPRREELEALLPVICKDLGKKGMTTLKQWDKYIREHPDGYGLTQFCLAVQHYRTISNPSMRMEHNRRTKREQSRTCSSYAPQEGGRLKVNAGDKMFVDYTGAKLWIYPYGEEPRPVEVFVAILGCSLLTYVEAVESQCKEDFISVCESALYYYGGAPQAIVPDNLKSAVTKASRHDPVLNEEFERFAEHYGIVGFPARVRKPKDKSHVENAVKLTYKDIFTALEGLHCPDVASLNIAIRSALERHNNKNLDRRNYSRREYFEDVERDALRPLNPIRFQIKKHLMATVDKYGYVRLRDDAHFYSVPHTYIGKKLKIYYTSTDVEVWSGYDKVAHHTRDRHEYRHTTDPEHLCPKHKAIAEWSPEKFISQAGAIHEDVEHYMRKILEKTSYGDLANKYCSGILNFVRKVGPERLAAACRLADSYGKYNYKEIDDILKNNSEAIDLPEEPADMPEHENIRGPEYYK